MPSNPSNPAGATPLASNCDFSFLIPTRNNLPGLQKLFDSIVETTVNLGALEVVLAIDEDDHESQGFQDSRLRLRKIVVPKGLTMGALNNACFEASAGRYLMLMNDDVVLRTKGWDRQVLATYRSFPDDIALIHVNDLLFRERLCTFPMLSRRACLAIGLCPTAYRRYRIDDHIYDTYNLLAHLGHRRVVYLPEVIFEHENHVSEAAPEGSHQFASADKKVYVPKAGIIELDAKYCDDHFSDRKAAALQLAEIIENDAHRRTLETLQRAGSQRLAAVSDSHSYRRPSYLQVRPTGMVRNSQNARTTVAVVTADASGEMASKCLAAIKQHTQNYDLVILDNNRGPNFNHPREMNRVLDTCHTEFLVLLDDDVFVEAGWLDGLLRCVDEETGVVVPLHKDRAGALSFSGIYFAGDGQGTHAHTLDRPQEPRVVQSYCSAAMLIDMRKCGHIRMDESYHKYFFDLAHGFEVWEAGWKAVCSPFSVVTHVGGATMTWGSAEANGFLDRDRVTFIRSWIANGRMAKLQQGAWQQHPYLARLDELPRTVETLIGRALQMPQAEFEQALSQTVEACRNVKLLIHRLVAGLSQQVVKFAAECEIKRIVFCVQQAARTESAGAEVHWLLAALDPLFQAKEFQPAESLLRDGLQRHAQNSDLWRALGITQMRAGNWKGALPSMEQATQFGPDDVESQGGLGVVLFQLERFGEAAERFQEAFRLCVKANPKDPRLPMLKENLRIALEQASKQPRTAPKAGDKVRTPKDLESQTSSQPTPAPAQRLAPTGQETPVSPLPQAADSSKGVPRILLIPFECAGWQNARAWSYTGYFAFEEGLKAAGASFVTLPAVAGFPSDHPASWLSQARELCRGQEFDQAWIWLTHNEYQPEFLEWLASVAPVRVGVVMESMQHTAEELKSYALLPGRQERVSTLLRHCTHVLAFDEVDAEALAADLPIRALWCPPIVPAASVCARVDLPVPGPAIFNGTLYSPERRAFLEHPKLRKRLIQPPLPENQTDLPSQFDAVQLAGRKLLVSGNQLGLDQLETHVAELRHVRRRIFALWLEAMQTGYATVNLPSIFKGYAGRVVESMAAGRPVISWEPPRGRTRALFHPGQEILLFDRKNPEELRRQIERLQQEPAFAQALAERAREKVLRFHTAEVRVRQILNWIANDTQPDYGEAPAAQNAAAANSRAAQPAEVSPQRGQSTGGSAAALAAAELAVERCPDDAEAWTRLARTALQGGRVDRFDSALARSMELDPNGRDALKLLGDLCAREGQIRNAVQSYHRLVQLHPNDLPVLYSLGFTLEQAGEWDCAFSLYDHLMRVAPQDTVLAQRVARLRKAHDRKAEAPALPARTPSPQAQQPQTEPISVVPATVVRPKQAAAPGKKPAMSLPSCALLGHIAQGRTLLTNKQHRAAWEFTTSAIQARPYHPEAYLLLAQIALAAGAAVPARLCAEHARKLAPDWKPAKKFLKGNLRGQNNPDWLVLPAPAQPLTKDSPTGSPKPRLSVFLITRNEEKFIGRCLSSVQGLADQIVVVDTGSTDRTIAIAQEHGGEIHHFQWCDDFSAARNAALEHVTGDWVLMLDADEELSPEGHAQLREHMAQSGVMAWRLPLIDVGHEDEGCSYVPRLFRNAPALFFVGRVHEQVFSSLEVRRAEWGLDNRLGQATLIHHGYTKEMVRDRNKIARNLHLLERAVEEMPEEPNLLMSLGQELARSGREAEALDRYWQAYELMVVKPAGEITPELRETLLSQFTTRLMAAKQFDGIVRVLTAPVAKTCLTASLHFALGLAHQELGQFAEAAAQMRACLDKRGQRCLCPINKDTNTAAPYHVLALCEMALGNVAAAEAAFQAGLKESVYVERIRLEYARFLFEQRRPLDALARLNDAVAETPKNAALWLLGGQIALSQPEFLEFACDWTGEAARQCPEDLGIAAQRAEACLLSGQFAAAGDLWQNLWDAEHQPQALAALILCGLGQGSLDDLPQPAAANAAATARAFIGWYRKCLSSNAQELVGRVNDQLADLRGILPEAAQILETVLLEAAEPALA